MTTHNNALVTANDNLVPQISDITTQHDTDVHGSEANRQLSIRYNGVDVYEACAKTLRPQGLLNDNIVSVMLE